MGSPYETAAAALLAKIDERGGADGVGHLDAHGVVRQALGVETTSPTTWRATRAGLDAARKAGATAITVAAAIKAGHANDGPEEPFPASLYGTGDVNKPSQWVTPERRAALLGQTPLGREVLGRDKKG